MRKVSSSPWLVHTCAHAGEKGERKRRDISAKGGGERSSLLFFSIFLN